MRRLISSYFTMIFLISSVYAQDLDHQLRKKYEAAKHTFLTFEKEHRGSIQTANHRISYLQWGRHRDKVFIWLPGSFLSAYDFYPFADALVKAGYSVLSVDHYGHGLTDIPKEDLDFWDFADDLASLMDNLKIKTAVVGGFSRGAYIATAFYDRHPEKVTGLVLEDGGTVAFKSLFDQMTPEAKQLFFGSVEPPLEVKKLLFGSCQTEFDIFSNINQIDGSPEQWQIFGFVKHRAGQWYLYHGLNEYMHMQDSIHYIQLLDRPSEVSRYAASMLRVDPMKTYRTLKVPMLILDAVGKDDSFDGRKGNRQLKDMHPELIEHQLFDCADHNIHFSCPQDFLTVLTKFLKPL